MPGPAHVEKNPSPIPLNDLHELGRAVQAFALDTEGSATPTMRTFSRAIQVIRHEDEMHRNELQPLIGPLRNVLREIYADVRSLRIKGLTSDFGYFMVDAGLGPQGLVATYRSLPDYYEKIERGLQSAPDLLAKFVTVKVKIAEIIAIDRYFVSPNITESLGAIYSAVADLAERYDGGEEPSAADWEKLNSDSKYDIRIEPFSKKLIGVGADAVTVLRDIAGSLKEQAAGCDWSNYPDAADQLLEFAEALTASQLDEKFNRMREKLAASLKL